MTVRTVPLVVTVTVGTGEVTPLIAPAWALKVFWAVVLARAVLWAIIVGVTADRAAESAAALSCACRSAAEV